jgi:glutamate formiminotransferase
MTLLTVPNWSFGRNRDLSQKFGIILGNPDINVHYFQGDADHNRTVTAFSGPVDEVEATLLSLCDVAFDAIDLNRHNGVHPRIGALDVCPFIARRGESDQAVLFVEGFAEKLANRYGLPVFLYEKSEHGRHESDLPALRKGGFGGMLGKELHPDYGPTHAHPRLGATVLGVRDFLIALNVNLRTEDLQLARTIAKEMRSLRTEGDPRFLGVRALGLLLASKSQVQISMNLTLPDLVQIDSIVEWVQARAKKEKVPVAGTELIGVIRRKDMESATWLSVAPEQVLEAW